MTSCSQADTTQCGECELKLQCDVPFRDLFEKTEECMWLMQENRFVLANEAAAKIYGATSVEGFVGLHPSEISPQRQPCGTLSEDKADAMMAVARETGYHRFEWLSQRIDGSLFYEEITLTSIRFCGEPALFAVGRDITLFKKSQQDLNYLANHDPLTGLPNQRYLEKQLVECTWQAQQSGDSLALFFLDLDDFKIINDGLGHRAGDALLVAVADRLRISPGSHDIQLFRLGGDEFVLLLQHYGTPEQLQDLAEKVLAEFEHPFFIENRQLYSSASLGIAEYPKDGINYQQLMKNAHAALFRCKAQGKNNFVLFQAEMGKAAEHRLDLEQALRQALLQEQLEVHYQPQYYAGSGKLVAAEALVRWQHQSLGWVGPNEFIPLAEQSGLIVPLGRWVVETVCQHFYPLQQANPGLQYIAVNFSILEVEHPDFLEQLLQTLSKHQLKPEQMMLEITESSVMKDPEYFCNIMHQARQHGFKLSIDDFGTGYSSLSHLKKMPLNQLKIDRSFVSNLTSDNKDLAIVHSVVSMASALGLHTVAEGVENEETAQLLAKIGCEQVQGYYFARPMPFAQMLKSDK